MLNGDTDGDDGDGHDYNGGDDMYVLVVMLRMMAMVAVMMMVMVSTINDDDPLRSWSWSISLWRDSPPHRSYDTHSGHLSTFSRYPPTPTPRPVPRHPLDPPPATQHDSPGVSSDTVSVGYSGVVFAWMVVLSLKPDAVSGLGRVLPRFGPSTLDLLSYVFSRRQLLLWCRNMYDRLYINVQSNWPFQ